MEWKTAGILGVIAGVTAMSAPTAQAAVQDSTAPAALLAVASYGDLLKPIPNAVELLRASNAELLQKSNNSDPNIVKANWRDDHHHHHEHYAPPPRRHHHHRHYYAPPRPVYHHHDYRPPVAHHHHHHAGAVIVVPSLGIRVN